MDKKKIMSIVFLLLALLITLILSTFTFLVSDSEAKIQSNIVDISNNIIMSSS